ncbi:UPF0175 family protein [Aneurinibacillus danicus]|uniref:Uncharacterized protein n=1 Tax=Aneurinibacillus danicus TaxID=267746 RepID=A0A511VHP3_9BACL|nr:UPF0175 family protein [Aneurinibacillus danicus]GEN36692.1 hypothetical protein ADA01nite_41520 [Aneurinibacillus danicus]
MKEEGIKKFLREEISLWRAAELAGVPLFDFIDLLREKGIPWNEYTEEHREYDDKTLRWIEKEENR